MVQNTLPINKLHIDSKKWVIWKSMVRQTLSIISYLVLIMSYLVILRSIL